MSLPRFQGHSIKKRMTYFFHVSASAMFMRLSQETAPMSDCSELVKEILGLIPHNQLQKEMIKYIKLLSVKWRQNIINMHITQYICVFR